MAISSKIKRLILAYRERRPAIKKRLKEFASLRGAADKDIFKELCFCILTANAKATSCDRAIEELKRTGLLFTGSRDRIKTRLKGHARFHNKKAAYIVGARKFFSKPAKNRRPCFDIKTCLDNRDIIGTRDWLVEKIKGYGYKEASHFLRNIGLGKDIAILDRHILKNLKRYGVIDKIPDSIGKRSIYLDIEDKARRFSKRISIPLEEMDLLFWSLETGFIFK